MSATTISTVTTPKDALLESGVFSRADVESLSARLNEPDWRKQNSTLSVSAK